MSEKRVNGTLIVVGLLAGALLVGAVLAPYIWGGLVAAGRRWALLSSLRDLEFEKVARRTVLIVLLMLVLPAVRLSGLNSWKRLGLGRVTGMHAMTLGGVVAGVLSMGSLLAAGLLSGCYRWDGPETAAILVGRITAFAAGAAVVAVLEEVVFRGVLFGLLRRHMRVLPAALCASLVFAAVHFASPEPPVGVVHADWNAGLRMLPYMFTAGDFSQYHGIMFVTLFSVGLALCFFYEYFGSLYFAIGLHAAWVWEMKMGMTFLERTNCAHSYLFGPSEIVAKSPAGAVLATSVAVAAACLLMVRGRSGLVTGAPAAWD